MLRFAYPFITFVGVVLIGELLLYNLYNKHEKTKSRTLNAASYIIIQQIQRQINIASSSTLTLESILRLNNFNTDKFDLWGKEILKNSSNINSIQLAPKGILRYVYPLKNNENILGHDLLKDKLRQKGAREAMKSNNVIFTGPLKLVQNDNVAIISRKAIYKIENELKVFWGFSVSVILIDDIIKKAFKGLDKTNMAFKLYGKDSDSISGDVIIKSEYPINENAIIYPIELPNGEWHLAINYINKNSYNSYYFHSLIILFALFSTFFIYYLEKSSFQKTKELNDLNNKLNYMANTDILTKLPNRRSALIFMEKQLNLCKREGKDFSLCFLDIDFFKRINDNYGHDIGDLALQHFSKLAAENIRKSDMLTRWGGEEFILILPITDTKGAYKICENLRNKIQYTLLDKDNIKIKITVSIGSLIH